jgi:hypothetical protein
VCVLEDCQREREREGGMCSSGMGTRKIDVCWWSLVLVLERMTRVRQGGNFLTLDFSFPLCWRHSLTIVNTK